MKTLALINPKQETNKIIRFLKKIQKKTKLDKIVIGLSGGVDSAVVLNLLTRAYLKKNIYVSYMPYDLPLIRSWNKDYREIKELVEILKIPKSNFFAIPISGPSEKIIYQMKTAGYSGIDKIMHEVNDCFTCPNIDIVKKTRMGNIMARLRMIFLFDLAKRFNGLVAGTENKSEHLLGYYTRFGDGASDIEPIIHLYKTQVYQLAKYLKVPKKIIEKEPSAGLWPCQTDEGEFGFTYKEADWILYLNRDKKIPLDKIPFKNARRIFERVKDNQFKQEVPYKII